MGLFSPLTNTAGGFLGLSGGPDAPAGQFGNPALQQLNGLNGFTDMSGVSDQLQGYANGSQSLNQVLNGAPEGNSGLTSAMINTLASNPLTATKFATDQVQNNSLLSPMLSEMPKQTQILDNLQNQGFQLTPDDQTLYGQAAGNIARQFGQQGNNAAANLAARGLSNSGAAGAQFSGLAGNQNEMLAQAQQQIMQQRFQNTQNQIAQQQGFINQLGGQAQNALNSQRNSNMQGVQNRQNSLMGASGANQNQNNMQNQYNMNAADWQKQNAPGNFMDYALAGAGGGLFNGAGTSVGKKTQSMFGGGGGAGGTQLAGDGGMGAGGAAALA